MNMEGCGHIRLRKDLFPGGQGCQPLLTTFPRPFLAGCDPHIQGRTEGATGAVPRGLLKAVSGSTAQLTCISAPSCLCLSRGPPTPGAPGGRETEEHMWLQGLWWHRSLWPRTHMAEPGLEGGRQMVSLRWGTWPWGAYSLFLWRHPMSESPGPWSSGWVWFEATWSQVDLSRSLPGISMLMLCWNINTFLNILCSL